MNILCVVGTRPEAIKMAPVIRALAEDDRTRPIVCVTGQHREMLDSVLSLYAIQPDFDLDIMTPRQSLTELTCSMLRSLHDVIEETRPDVLLAQGDTTTMTAALAAFYQKVLVGHIEAGLRTDDIYSP